MEGSGRVRYMGWVRGRCRMGEKGQEECGGEVGQG